jgi:hypothetical protein
VQQIFNRVELQPPAELATDCAAPIAIPPGRLNAGPAEPIALYDLDPGRGGRADRYLTLRGLK